MKYNFSEKIDRTNTDSAKWDYMDEIFGSEDLIPMWVADSDWPTAPSIIKALKERVEHGVFGYTSPGDRLNEVIVRWIKDHYNWSIDPEWIVHGNGVVPSINIAIKAYTNPGDEVILQSPVYYPFYSSIQDNGTHVINNQLKLKEGRYYFDLDDLKQKLQDTPHKTSRAKVLILCSPHNPVGRVWDKDELKELSKICFNNNLMIISDEIHADFTYDKEHIPLASISEELAQNTITLMAPSKTFNIAGLHTSFAVIPNKNIRREFTIHKNGYMGSGGVLGLTAMEAAYSNGGDWLKEQLCYLKENILGESSSRLIPQSGQANFSLKVYTSSSTTSIWTNPSV